MTGYRFNYLSPNPDKPEPKKEINHESTKGRKHEKKDKTNFVFSKFRGFVVRKFFHKMQRIHN